jgi:hypothetical protein
MRQYKLLAELATNTVVAFMNKKWLLHGITRGSFVIFIVLGLTCASSRLSSATTTGPRTIILYSDTISEYDVGGFVSWRCYAFSDYDKERLLLEVGKFGDTKLEGLGYILYDGGYMGTSTNYRRTGIEHRWDWGYGNQYTFVIKSNGTGLYYDFSNAEFGESIKARDIFKCTPPKVSKSISPSAELNDL